MWGRQSYRFSEQDLKGKSFDGYGEDWPLCYKDLEPYYDIVEDYVGISGQAEDVPELPDSSFHPAMPMTCAETQLRTRVKEKLGRTVTIGRTANITKPINGRAGVPLLRAVRARVHHALLLQRRVHHRRRRARRPATARSSPNAMVYKVLTDQGTGKRDGRALHRPRDARAEGGLRQARWCCARRRSSPTRILLNSSTPRVPERPRRTRAACSGTT